MRPLCSPMRAGATLLALALASACGGSGAPVVRDGNHELERITLSASKPRGAATPEVVREILPPENVEDWDSHANRVVINRIPVDGERVPVFLLAGRDEKKLVNIPGDFDPQTFNQILLRVITDKRENVQVVCRRKGKKVLASEKLSVEAAVAGEKRPGGEVAPEPRILLFDMPKLRRVQESFDGILFQFDGLARNAAIVEVALLLKPLATFVPAPDRPELVQIRPDLFELRRAVGLFAGDPLSGSFRGVAGAELAFSLGMPELLRVGGQNPKVVVTLEGANGARESQSFGLEAKMNQPATWHDHSLDLTPFAGTTVDLRFELEVDGPYAGVCAVGEPRLRKRGSDAPGVLLITSDTHRADHIGPTADDGLVVTPTLDALAARGVLFEDCYASTNVTNPSHVALMTAVHPRDTRIIDNHAPLVEEAGTLAEQFRAAGYRTFAALSARHLVHAESGLGQGFDRMSAPRHADRDGGATIDILEGWLDESAGEPLFVWLHVFDAHAPYGPPKPFDRRYYPKDKNPYDTSVERELPERLFPPFLKNLTDVEFPYAQYRAEVDYLDRELKRVIEREPFLTGAVAFTADHGEAFGQHGVYWDHAELYPDTVHIPLIVAWPGAPGGTRVEAPVRQIDVGRTLLNLAGLDEAPFGGRDLRWTMNGEDEAPRFLISAHGFSAAIESRGWHLILHLRKHHQKALLEPREHHQVELYNLREDPQCENDLVEKEMDRASIMRAALIDWLESAQAGGLGSAGTQSADALDALVELGYVEGGDGPAVDEPWFNAEEDEDCAWCERFE